MKKLGLLMMLLILSRIALFCQSQTAGIEEKEVLKNEDVVFRQIDEHTWLGYRKFNGEREPVSGRGRYESDPD